MRYAIIGFGRCGSHWTSDLVAAITQLEHENNIHRWRRYPSVLHTHEIEKILPILRESDCMTVACVRHNSFQKIISQEVARYTNEYNNYTDQQFDPFWIDPKLFALELTNDQELTVRFLQSLEQQKINHCVSKYEDLVAADDPYAYIAKLINHPVPDQYPPLPDHRNPRDYSQLVTNYHELRNIWDRIQDELI